MVIKITDQTRFSGGFGLEIKPPFFVDWTAERKKSYSLDFCIELRAPETQPSFQMNFYNR